ncbi:MAG TPA: hypothetical protein VNN76_06095 [Bacteroidota bacterium]|nr:hypothetical protein [Bacteroidota bacterium]
MPIDREDLGITTCSACQGAFQPMLLFEQAGIHPSKPGHNIGYNHSVISACTSCGRGMIEILKHDCFDFEEVWDQYEWYSLEAEDMHRLQEVITRCSTPLVESCTCALHTACRSAQLPARWWHWALEGEQHMHPMSIRWLNGLPQFVPADPPPTGTATAQRSVPSALGDKSEVLEIDREFPTELFRKLNPNDVQRLLGETLEKETSVLRILSRVYGTLIAALTVYTLTVFGWWSAIVLPIVGFGIFVCYALGAPVNRKVLPVAFLIVVGIGGLTSFLPEFLPWYISLVAICLLGGGMNALAGRYVKLLKMRNGKAAEVIREK